MTPGKTDAVSVIIPTYNGARRIMRVLEALRAQTTPGFEVVVVIDGSTDDTAERVEEARSWFERIRVIRQENAGRAAVRNRGAAEASEDLLVFLDDDMHPAPGCVDAHVAHHTLHPGSLVSGTQYEVDGPEETSFTRFRARLRRQWDAPLRQIHGPLPFERLHMTAANFSIERAVFERLGGFDPRLNDGEDLVLLHQAHRAGVPIFYSESAYATHHDEATCRGFVNRLRQYHAAREKVLELHPELGDVVHLPMRDQGLGRKVFYALASRPSMVHWIDRGGGGWLPTSVYDRMCASVVWGLGHVHRDREV